MVHGTQQSTVNWQSSTTSTTSTMPNLTATVRLPYQQTPDDVYNYLKEMGFTHTTTPDRGDVWMRNGTNTFFTWEQAVTYCLIKPFLNP